MTDDKSESQAQEQAVVGSNEGQPAPKIEYPCSYSLKVVGDNSENFCDDMLDVIEKFDPKLNRKKTSFQDSRNGRFRSLRATITATSEEQVKSLFDALKATGRVHMVI